MCLWQYWHVAINELVICGMAVEAPLYSNLVVVPQGRHGQSGTPGKLGKDGPPVSVP